MARNAFAGLQLILEVHAFFLKTGVIDAKHFGNFVLLKEPLKYFVIYASKNSLLSFKSFTARSVCCIAFELLKILISFATSASVKVLKVNLSQFQ